MHEWVIVRYPNVKTSRFRPIKHSHKLPVRVPVILAKPSDEFAIENYRAPGECLVAFAVGDDAHEDCTPILGAVGSTVCIPSDASLNELGCAPVASFADHWERSGGTIVNYPFHYC